MVTLILDAVVAGASMYEDAWSLHPSLSVALGGHDACHKRKTHAVFVLSVQMNLVIF